MSVWLVLNPKSQAESIFLMLKHESIYRYASTALLKKGAKYDKRNKNPASEAVLEATPTFGSENTTENTLGIQNEFITATS